MALLIKHSLNTILLGYLYEMQNVGIKVLNQPMYKPV